MKCATGPIFLFLLVSSCSEHKQAETGPARESLEAPIMGRLKTTSYQITLHSTSDGPLYTIQDTEGNVLAEKLSSSGLAKRFPEINHEIRGVWAENFIKDRRRSGESPVDDPGIREPLWREFPPPREEIETKLPPLPNRKGKQ